MIYPSIAVNLSRLYKYYPQLTETYKTLRRDNDDPIEIKVPIAIHIEPEQEDAFTTCFGLLMQKYSIDHDYWADLIYINQHIISELDQLNRIEEEIEPDNDNAIRFLIAYQELVEEEKLNIAKLKLTTKEIAKRDPIAIHVKNKGTNGGHTLDYFKSGPFIMKLIYNAFKTKFSNPTLSYLLEPYPEIPTKEELQNMIPSLKLSRTLKIILRETAEILTDYFDRHIPAKVHSRKKNLIIFELLYLFGTLKHGGKIVGKHMEQLPERTLSSTYSLPVSESKCTAIIKELLKKDIS